MKMQSLRGILMENLSELMQKVYAKSLCLMRSMANSLHSLSTTPLITLAFHSFHKWKRTLQVI